MIDPSDLALIKLILVVVLCLVGGAWIGNQRAARRHALAQRHHAESLIGAEAPHAYRELVSALRADFEPRLQLIEQQLRHVPTDTDLARLGGRLDTLATKLDGYVELQAANRASLQRIENYLLEGRRT